MSKVNNQGAIKRNKRTLSELLNSFKLLRPYMDQSERYGICLKTPEQKDIHAKQSSLALQFYYADSSTEDIIKHNLEWVSGKHSHPIFQFLYLMLPTPCNQRCQGCFMGKDKALFPEYLKGPYFFKHELEEILRFAKDHGAKSIVYGGGGELFTWKGAFEFIETIYNAGLKTVFFTNGTLLSRDDMAKLNSMDAAIIISIRDTVESYHNAIVGTDGFIATLKAIEYALSEGFQNESRLAVEIPVTKDNEQRIIDHFLPTMRALGIVPMIEEYIQISTSDEEKSYCHSFMESKKFFEKSCQKDSELGISWKPEFGQRMLAQPQCRRPLYSFSIFPSRDVMDCPSHEICYGNLKEKSLNEIIYSEKFKNEMLKFKYCACSVFYISDGSEIPEDLPDYLKILR